MAQLSLPSSLSLDTGGRRPVSRLMGGWNAAHEEEFLGPMVAQLDEVWKSDPDGSERRGKIDRVRAWIDEHPGGVERELLS